MHNSKNYGGLDKLTVQEVWTAKLLKLIHLPGKPCERQADVLQAIKSLIHV